LIITTVYTNIYTPLEPDNCAYGGTCVPTDYKAGVNDTLDMVSTGFKLMSLMVIVGAALFILSILGGGR
jgi:hypothetical protein